MSEMKERYLDDVGDERQLEHIIETGVRVVDDVVETAFRCILRY